MTAPAVGNSHAPSAPRSAGPGAVRVAVIDLDSNALPDLDAWYAGGLYPSALVFGTRGGRPVAEARVDLAPGGCDPAEVCRVLLDAAAPPAPAPAAHDLPGATVVVPTALCRPELLARCLTSLADLDYPDVELLVVANRSDGVSVPDDLARLPRVRVIVEPRPGTAAARNRGLREAGGEIVAFTDDDVVVDRGWLRALAARFVAEPDVECVNGLVLPAELDTPAQVWFEQSGNAPGRQYRPSSHHVGRGAGRFTVLDRRDDAAGRSLYALGGLGTGSNMAFRTAALLHIGGFDEALGPGTPAQAGEDLLVFVRLLSAGRYLAIEPGAVVWHTHRRDYPELAAQLQGYGVGLTAMLTAAVLRDPRHAIGLLRVALPALQSLVGHGGGSRRRLSRPADYPRELARAELRGMLRGPMAYLSGRRRMRRCPG
jgi:GT2 family glycosyltransferase